MKFSSKLIATFLIASCLFAPAAMAQQKAAHFVGQFKQAQDKRMEADKALLLNMELTADWLVNFKTKKGHFPEPGVEQDKGIVFLQKSILKASPYSSTGVVSSTEAHPCPVRFLNELGLTDSRRQEWQKSPPSSWRGEPGTITIITGYQNYFLIWGAGADHMPIYDPKDNHYWLVWREFAD